MIPKLNTKGKFLCRCASQRVAQVLKEFGDVLTNEFPNELHPEREVDHKIELTLRAESQNKVLYRRNEVELVQLK